MNYPKWFRSKSRRVKRRQRHAAPKEYMSIEEFNATASSLAGSPVVLEEHKGFWVQWADAKKTIRNFVMKPVDKPVSELVLASFFLTVYRHTLNRSFQDPTEHLTPERRSPPRGKLTPPEPERDPRLILGCRQCGTRFFMHDKCQYDPGTPDVDCYLNPTGICLKCLTDPARTWESIRQRSP